MAGAAALAGRERPQRGRRLVVPAVLAFLVAAPVVFRAADESSGDSALMIGALIGGIVGVWRGRELTPVGIPRGTGMILVAGDRWGALVLGAALLAEGLAVALSGGEAIGPLTGLVGAAAAQLVGWHVGVYGRVRRERSAALP